MKRWHIEQREGKITKITSKVLPSSRFYQITHLPADPVPDKWIGISVSESTYICMLGDNTTTFYKLQMNSFHRVRHLREIFSPTTLKYVNYAEAVLYVAKQKKYTIPMVALLKGILDFLRVPLWEYDFRVIARKVCSARALKMSEPIQQAEILKFGENAFPYEDINFGKASAYIAALIARDLDAKRRSRKLKTRVGIKIKYL